MTSTHEYFPGFRTERVAGSGAEIFVRIGGSGPPLLCLHGHPETHLMWHRVAGELARHFTVVLADLRGYGASSVPAADAAHEAYSKRAMAADMIAVMAGLGFAQFRVMGHDRGGRAAYRMALDQPDVVERLVVLDIVPTLDCWERIDGATMGQFWHWSFLAQPSPFPDDLLAAAPAIWVDSRFRRGRSEIPHWADRDVLAIYSAHLEDPARILAICEDFRAGASIDVAHDRADREAGRTIACPVQALWGSEGNVSAFDDPVATWRTWAPLAIGQAIDSGHFIPEQNPDALLEAVLPFLLPA